MDLRRIESKYTKRMYKGDIYDIRYLIEEKEIGMI